MIAVGICGAQLGMPAIWLLPVTFPIVMAIGGFLGLIGIRLPGVEFGRRPRRLPNPWGPGGIGGISW
jgi:hydrogenase/urease accessory protein HupE